MANTVFQHKRSGTPASVPSVLEFGELAINYADGLIFYKNSTSHIVSISGGGGGNAFGTINANGTLVVSDTAGDVLNLVAGNNITIVGDVVNDKITIGLKDTISISGDANVGKLYIAAAGGDEGGELRLDKPPNGTLAGGVVIDAYQNKIRIFEDNGTNRGVYIDLSSASASVGTDLLASSGSTDNVARSTAVAAFAAANASFLAANSAFANGNTTHTLAITSFAAANASFANSNTNFTTLQTVFGVANAAFLAANSAFANANGTHTLTVASFGAANAAFANANTTHTLTIAAFSAANASFANGNTNFTVLQTVSGVANAAFSNANTTHTLTIAAFGAANASFLASNSKTKLLGRDIRTIYPANTTNGYVEVGFTTWNNDASTPYADFVHLRTYTDASGGSDNLLTFRKDAIGMRLWQHSYFATTPYAAYKDVAFTSDLSTGNAAIIQANTARDHANAAFLAANSAGGGLSYTSNVGNAVANTFNITHALNTTTIIPAVRERSTGYYVYPDMKVTSPNNIVLEFVSVPTSNQYFLIVLGV